MRSGYLFLRLCWKCKGRKSTGGGKMSKRGFKCAECVQKDLA